jgi:hypothetical protein
VDARVLIHSDAERAGHWFLLKFWEDACCHDGIPHQGGAGTDDTMPGRQQTYRRIQIIESGAV